VKYHSLSSQFVDEETMTFGELGSKMVHFLIKLISVLMFLIMY